MARAVVAHALFRVGKSSMAALESLELFERARARTVDNRAGVPPALSFDRGVALADLGLCRSASQAFALSAMEESDDDWRREALERRAALPCLGANFPGSSLDEHLDRALDGELRTWAQSVAGSPASHLALLHLTKVGDELRGAGESIVSDVAREVAESDSRRPELRQAMRDASLGRSAFIVGDIERSRHFLNLGCGPLDRYGSALAGWCRYWRLAVGVYDGDLAGARSGLARLRRRARSPYLRGRSAWSEGLAAFRQGELYAAHDLYLTAAREFAKTQLKRSHAAVEVLRAEALSTLGAFAEAAQIRRGALVDLQAEPHLMLTNGLIDGAADAHAMGFERAAARYLAEAALISGEKGDLVTQTEIRLLQGELDLRTPAAQAVYGKAVDRSTLDIRSTVSSLRGGPPQDEGSAQLLKARAKFSTALVLASSLSGLARERNVANAELGLAESGDPEYSSALSLLSLAKYFEGKGPRSGELRALVRLAEVAEGTGDDALAARIDRRAREVIGAQRSAGRELERDARLVDSLRAYFDRMIASALRRGDAWSALALIAEAAPGETASGLADRANSEENTVAADPSSAFRAALFGGLGKRTMIVYRFLGDELAWWCVRAGSLRRGSISDARRIHRLIGDLRSAAGWPGEDRLESAYRLLLDKPLVGVPEGEPVILVPDRDLASVPFPALRNSGSRVRLIERHPLSLAMSPRTLLSDQALRRGQIDRSERARAAPRAAVIGDPAFDFARLPWLGRLPRSANEAREVAAVYGSEADLLLGRRATADAVESSVRRATVLHFAVHSLSGSDQATAALVLARDDTQGGSGLVSAEEIAREAKRADVVVLSACGTLDSRGPDGLIGMAGPFLDHGARAVVGTLWPVDDKEVVGWMVEFHRALAEGASASRALQRVQVRASANGSCCRWAAFALVGDATLSRPEPRVESN